MIRKTIFLILIFFSFCGHQARATVPQARPLGAQDLAWGETQVRRMLADRPAMRPYVKEGDALWNWTVRQFAGEWVPGGVLWVGKVPSLQWDAECFLPSPGYKAAVYVSANSMTQSFHPGKVKTGPWLWEQAAYELLNIKYGVGAVTPIEQAAQRGEIGPEEYCFRIFFIEDQMTEPAARDYFSRVWIPNCRQYGLDPWDDYSRKYVVLEQGSAPAAFVNGYFSVDYSNPRPVDENFVFHRNDYLKRYRARVVPVLEKNGIAVPAAENMVELKKKIGGEFGLAVGPGDVVSFLSRCRVVLWKFLGISGN